MKLHTRKKLVLNSETLRNLSIRTAIKAGAPTAECTMVGPLCG